MRLTSFTDYTLRVLIYLGTQRKESRLSTISDISAAYGISENHLMKVVHYLGREGYVVTQRGKGGGMRLARPPEQIRIGDVVRGTEEDMAIVECFQAGNRNCPITPVCPLRGALARAVSAFFTVLDGYTLADLVKPRAQLARIFATVSERDAATR